MSLGPVMLDLAGLQLDSSERERLAHTQVGGVILFSRNYDSPDQLVELTQQIHAIKTPRLIVAVDQEGGRVQRFREGFQTLPSMASIGEIYPQDAQKAVDIAQTTGWIMASELLHYGVDLSFSPVLDIGNPVSSVIGDRAFHQDPEIITRLANAWIRGMSAAGMEAVAKHFPGHGSVQGDSHHVMPFDKRDLASIEALDLTPFRRVIETHLTAIMMAHVIYDQVDNMAAGFSRFWVDTILRNRLGFDGVIFSDDLSMAGAESAGGYADRARKSLQAGCDMILVCNNPAGADEVLDGLSSYSNPTSQLRMIRLHGKSQNPDNSLFKTSQWQSAIQKLGSFNQKTHPNDNGDLFE